MYHIQFVILSLFISVGFFLNSNAQELRINELMSSNRDLFYDEDGDTPDWIEIINTTEEIIHLKDYYLSDDLSELSMWQFPEIDLIPEEPYLIYASGKDRRDIPSYWSTVVDYGDEWKYIIPNSYTSEDWRSVSFNDSSWETGPSGFGYGDNDDATRIPEMTVSVFMRKIFNVERKDLVKAIWLHMDYDDAFVAYLNGVEIARSGIGQRGDIVAYDQTASQGHEALIYKGGVPEGFDITDLEQHLVEGNNVLAIQVHNIDVNSSDLSAIPFLTLGYSQNVNPEKPLTEYFELPKSFPHANFKLSSSGETVCISKNDLIIDTLTYGVIPGRYSYGLDPSNFSMKGYFSIPTPGEHNDSGFLAKAITNRVQFSVQETFLSGPAELTLSGSSEGQQIRYTLNGEDPTVSSKIYYTPLSLSSNTVVRAKIFGEDAVPGVCTSRSYIFDEVPTLPVICMATDSVHLWDNEEGIYVLGDEYEQQDPHYGANYWEEWEKPAYIEMVNIEGNQLFSMNCGIKIFGGWSRMRPQKSLAVFFRNEYGDPELEGVQLFGSKPIDKFTSLVLRNGGNDYDFGRIRDGMMTSLVRNMDTDISAYQPVVMYLNGEYWGIISLREKINEDYLEANHGVGADELDLLQWNGSVIEGSSENYLSLISFLEENDMNSLESYKEIERRIDLSNYIDYQISQIYFDNRDWPGNNLKYWRPQTDDGKWRWIIFDTDFGFAIYEPEAFRRNTLEFATATDGPNWPNPPWSTFILRRLLENETFRHRFINRYADILNTTFLPELVIRHIDSLAHDIEPEVPRHAEKWQSLWPDWWQTNLQRMHEFAKYRGGYVRYHIREEFELPGQHKLEISVLPAMGGEVGLNSIIVDNNWSGTYFQNVPVSLTARPAPGFKFHSWVVGEQTYTENTIKIDLNRKTLVRVIYEESDDDGNSVVFNEINYNSPYDSNAGDWVELFNWGREDLDISGWLFKDDNDIHSFSIPEGTILKSHEYLVLCRNIDNFRAVHPQVSNYTGEFDFGLSSSGDVVKLFDKAGNLVDMVAFGSETPWPSNPNGYGPTLEFRHYSRDNSKAESWESSLTSLGTPGRENSVTTNLFLAEDSEKKLMIWPNPFSKTTRIQIKNSYTDEKNIRIYSIDGRIVFESKCFEPAFVWNGTGNNGENLKRGIYLCQVKTGNEVFVKKIVLYR